MAEFASKGVAGTGLGLGIAGTALGVLAGNNNGNGGILGGLLGNGNSNVISALQAENTGLKAEKYSDRNDAETYAASRAENAALRTEIFNYITPLANEAASNRERVAVLEAKQTKDAEIADLREKLIRAELGGQIAQVAQAATTGLQNASAQIAGLQQAVQNITKVVVPTSAICPTPMPLYNSWTAPTTSTTTA